jgi:hypothetical protein
MIVHYVIHVKKLTFEIIMAVTMESNSFRNVTLCSLVYVYRRFGGM